MSGLDIVAELEAMLAGVPASERAPILDTIKGARDEIVALRAQRPAPPYYRITPERLAEIRAEALEEAAQACEREGETAVRQIMEIDGRYGDALFACEECAAAIRALKDKADKAH